jgi:hypothetical protein
LAVCCCCSAALGSSGTAENIRDEYVHFLLDSLRYDRVVPPPRIYELWQAHILTGKNYLDVCAAIEDLIPTQVAPADSKQQQLLPYARLHSRAIACSMEVQQYHVQALQLMQLCLPFSTPLLQLVMAYCCNSTRLLMPDEHSLPCLTDASAHIFMERVLGQGPDTVHVCTEKRGRALVWGTTGSLGWAAGASGADKGSTKNKLWMLPDGRVVVKLADTGRCLVRSVAEARELVQEASKQERGGEHRDERPSFEEDQDGDLCNEF